MSFTSAGVLAEKTQDFITSLTPIVLLNSSPTIIRLVGSSTQEIYLPDATTCFVGMRYMIINRSTQNCTIRYQDGSFFKLLVTDKEFEFRLTDDSSANGDWTSVFKGDGEETSPLKLYASSPPNALLNIGPSTVAAGDTAGLASSPVDGLVLATATITINFQTGAIVGGTVTLGVGGPALVLPSTTVGSFRRFVFSAQSDGSIAVAYSAESLSLGSLTNAGILLEILGGRPLGYLNVEATAATAFKTPGSATNIIENSVGGIPHIFRFGVDAGNLTLGNLVGASTPGSILFSDTNSKLAENNTDLFWDESNSRLGVGTNTPTAVVDILGDVVVNSAATGVMSNFTSTHAGGIAFRAAVTNTGASAAYFIDGNAGNASEAVYIAKLGTGACINALSNGSGIGLILGGTSTGNRLAFQGSTSGTLGINVPAAVTSYNVILPAAQGVANSFLGNDGSGNLSWSIPSGSFSPYTKRVGPGEAYTTLTSVAAAAVAGDWILVTGNTADSADVDFTTNDIHIDWEPNAVSTFNGGAHTNMLILSGNRIKTNRMRISCSPSAGALRGVYVTGIACQVLGGHVTFDTAQSITTGVHVSGSYGQYLLTIENGGGATLGTAFSDTGVNSTMVVGP